MTDKGKYDPAIHAERTPFIVHGDEVLSIRKIAVKIKEQIGADVVVAVNNHGWGEG
jgi:hypothetical protein